LKSYINKKYFAKVLIFGEYGILFGSRALTLPYKAFHGSFTTGNQVNKQFEGFYQYIKSINHQLEYQLNIEHLYKEIYSGLTFSSNIPIGYGLGSSGALTAAVYSEFNHRLPTIQSSRLEIFKRDLALLESYFHGNSSGIDPLTSFLNKALFLNDDSSIRTENLKLNSSKYTFVLIDSGIEGKTGALVSLFIDKVKQDFSFKNQFIKAYHKYSDKAINALVKSDYDSVFRNFSSLSQFQLENMAKLIPEHIQTLFETGLMNGNFAIKICGSGGGGYFLAMINSMKISEFSHLKYKHLN
jgi:mevalonate kinase